MKKKSILVLLIIMCIGVFTPFLVNAKECNQESIKLKSIKLKEKSEYTEELTEATIDNNKINLDLKMYNVGDYIVYTLKVKNESDENYYFDENSLNINSNYFDYSLSYKDNSNKINPNKEKTIYLRVQYKKEVEKENFFSGKYKDNNIVSLLLTNNKKSIFTNPLTGSNKIILLLISMIILGIYLYYKKTNNIRLNIFIIIGLSLLIPISTYALCEVKLDINSNITIGKVKPNPCTYDGELVQGAEYVNGQYTYRYMQEGTSSDWQNIENDGWGVKLTDKDSTEDVTSKLCTSINDKPIVSMSSMFMNSRTSNIDLSSFDTSNATNMYGMFNSMDNIDTFDLSSFDTSNVTNMSAMFWHISNLKEINLSSFNTENLIDASAIISANTNLEYVNLDNWNLRSSKNGSNIIGGMFGGDNSIKKVSLKNWVLPESFTNAIGCRTSSLCSQELDSVNVTGWDLSKTTDLTGLFGNLYTKKIIGLESFDTSNIENMCELFSNNINITEFDLSTWKTPNVINLSKMFENNSSLKKVNLNGFNTSKVTNMTSMFYYNTSLEEVSLDGFDFSNVTNINSVFGGMFGGPPVKIKKISMKNWKIPEFFSYVIGCTSSSLCSNNLESIDVTGWNLSNTKNLNGLFGYLDAKEILGLDTWDTSNIVNMSNMFNSVHNIKYLDLSKWDTKNVIMMDNMFANSYNLKTIYVSDKFKTDNVTNSDNMFNNTSLLVGGNGTVYDSNHVDKEYARIDTPETPGYFTRK